MSARSLASSVTFVMFSARMPSVVAMVKACLKTCSDSVPILVRPSMVSLGRVNCTSSVLVSVVVWLDGMWIVRPSCGVLGKWWAKSLTFRTVRGSGPLQLEQMFVIGSVLLGRLRSLFSVSCVCWQSRLPISIFAFRVMVLYVLGRVDRTG